MQQTKYHSSKYQTNKMMRCQSDKCE